MNPIVRRAAPAACLALPLAFSVCGRGGPPEGPRAARQPSVWEEIRLGTDAVFNGIDFVDADVGWIVGGSPFVPGGIVGLTVDGGTTWRYRTGVTGGGIGSTLTAIHGFDRQRACAVGDRGILLTIDGGESWQPARHAQKAPMRLFGLIFLNESEGWAAGAALFHTTDSGMSWSEASGDGFPARHFAARPVHFSDSRNGWLGGQHGNLWRTRDGGETWARVPLPQPVPPPPLAPYLFGMTWPSASEGWVVGEFGTILHTSDDGTSWSLADAGTRQAFFTAVQFVGRSGWIVGYFPDKARSQVWRTADAGETWTVEHTLDGEELRALRMLDERTGWAVGDRVRTGPQRLLRRRPS